MQATLKFLEDSNVVIQTRNQNLITENKALNLQVKEERCKVAILNKSMNSLKEELARVRFRLNEIAEESSHKCPANALQENGTSTTDISSSERGVQVWAVCKACQRKLESCEEEPPAVTITKSQLELLEKDMRTLKDVIVLREEAWDKAMEREQNYRQQLTRLTVETITARHLSETRYQEVQGLTNTLLEKEAEVKSTQKDVLCLNKLIAKLYNCQQRGFEDSQGGNFGGEISEKDQKLIEEIVRRVASTKSKQKSKAKSGYSERTSHSGICQGSPRDNRIPRGLKDQPASTKESKR